MQKFNDQHRACVFLSKLNKNHLYTFISVELDRTCLSIHMYLVEKLCKTKDGEGQLVLLYYCWKSHGTVKKCFFQCFVLVDTPRKNLSNETDSESESQCMGQKSYVSPEQCCKIMDNRNLLSLDFMGVGLGLQMIKHFLFHSSLRCHNFSSQTMFQRTTHNFELR